MKNEWFGQAPYGYTVFSDTIGNRRKNTRLVDNPEEQRIIGVMKKMRDEGKSYREIATVLNEQRVPTRMKRKGKKTMWHPITIRNILMRSPGVSTQ
jgi:hypothetical protein